MNIPDIDKLESNIHAGIKYNRWVIDNFYQDPAISPVNRELFAFASYNAGPGKVASLRREAKAAGLDPNRWFNNVELVAAKRIGRETVTYVEQHLQVLPGVPDDAGPASGAGAGESRRGEALSVVHSSASRPPRAA